MALLRAPRGIEGHFPPMQTALEHVRQGLEEMGVATVRLDAADRQEAGLFVVDFFFELALCPLSLSGEWSQ